MSEPFSVGDTSHLVLKKHNSREVLQVILDLLCDLNEFDPSRRSTDLVDLLKEHNKSDQFTEETLATMGSIQIDIADLLTELGVFVDLNA